MSFRHLYINLDNDNCTSYQYFGKTQGFEPAVCDSWMHSISTSENDNENRIFLVTTSKTLTIYLKNVPKFVLICHSGESNDRRTQSKIEIRDRFLHTLVASKDNCLLWCCIVHDLRDNYAFLFSTRS